VLKKDEETIEPVPQISDFVVDDLRKYVANIIFVSQDQNLPEVCAAFAARCCAQAWPMLSYGVRPSDCLSRSCILLKQIFHLLYGADSC